jgi:hypothetical protein
MRKKETSGQYHEGSYFRHQIPDNWGYFSDETVHQPCSLSREICHQRKNQLDEFGTIIKNTYRKMPRFLLETRPKHMIPLRNARILSITGQRFLAGRIQIDAWAFKRS